MRRPTRSILVTGVLAPLAVVTACTSGDPAPAAPPPITRAQVGWMNTVCGEPAGLAGLDRPQTDGPTSLDFGGDRDITANSYVRQVVSAVDGSVGSLSTLPPLGSPAADAFVAERLRALRGIKRDVDRIGAEEEQAFDRTAAQSRDAATRVSRLVASMKSPVPDLPTVASGDTTLALAYDVAPGCDPVARQRVTAPPASPAPGSGLLPVAADGANLAACTDGDCQVRVDKPVEINVAGTLFEVDTDVLPITITTRFPGGGSGQSSVSVGSSGSFGSGVTGRTVTVEVDGAAGGAAILRFVTI